MTNNTQYEITREFTSGTLKGLTYTETTTVYLPVGFECRKPLGGSAYKIVKCGKVAHV